MKIFPIRMSDELEKKVKKDTRDNDFVTVTAWIRHVLNLDYTKK